MIIRTMHHHVKRTARRIGARQKKTTTHFSTYSRRALFDLPQTLMAVELVVSIGANHFSIQFIVFPLGGKNVDFWVLSKNKYRQVSASKHLSVIKHIHHFELN